MDSTSPRFQAEVLILAGGTRREADTRSGFPLYGFTVFRRAQHSAGVPLPVESRRRNVGLVSEDIPQTVS